MKVQTRSITVTVAGLLLCLCAFAPLGLCGEGAAEAKALISDSGVRGGLCLVLGGEPELARALAAESRMFVTLVRADERRALESSRRVDAWPERSRISVVTHAGGKLPYAQDLFNLIVVRDAKPGVALAELNRILVPGGVLCLKNPESGSRAEAGKLKMTSMSGSAGAAFRKPPLPASEDWGCWFGSPQLGNSVPGSTIEPTMGLRWRAGPRWNNRATAYDAMVCGGGVFIYRQINAVPGTFGKYRRVLIARDAFNGRELWRLAGKPVSPPRYGFWISRLIAAGGGRVCVAVNGKPVCLDAASGKVLYALARPKNRYIRYASFSGKYLICSGHGVLSVHAAADGRLVWQKRVEVRTMAAVRGETLYARMGETIFALRLDTGAELWKYDASKDKHPALKILGSVFTTGGGVHYQKGDKQKRYLFGLDLRTGKPMWSAEAENPKTVFPGFRDMEPSLKMVAFEDEIWFKFKKKAKPRGYSIHLTCVDSRTGRVKKKNFALKNGTTHCWTTKGAGNYLLYARNLFMDRRTMECSVNSLVRSVCQVGHIPASRQMFMLPHNCRCNTRIRGVLAMGKPAKGLKFVKPVARRLSGGASGAAQDLPTDWPMFRKDGLRSNSTNASLGSALKKKWEVPVGGKGLTQAVSAYGMVFVADGEGQRVVALDAGTGKRKWSFPVGSRMHYPPTLYRGLCLVTANNGWVHCLNARSGKPIWKMMVAPTELYIGGQDRTESLWPVVGDVLIRKGVGYVNAGHAGDVNGGLQMVAFDPASGRVLWSKVYTEEVSGDLLVDLPSTDAIVMNGRTVSTATQAISKRSRKRFRCAHISQDFGTYVSMDDYFMSNDRNRTNARRTRLGFGYTRALYLAFSPSGKTIIGVERAKPRPEDRRKGAKVIPDFRLFSSDGARKPKSKWEVARLGMRVDGIVVTPQALYCAGHSLVDDPDEESTLVVLSPRDGKRLGSVKLKDRPVPDGLSLAGGRLLLVTENGKVICFEGK